MNLKNALQRGKKHGSGFTLVEAIVVIVITGILSGMVAVFMRTPVEGYVASVHRAELTDAADTALRRIARDVRAALPNSLRTATAPAAGTSCIEFLPTLGGGRYRAGATALGTGDILDFSVADTSFDVLANSNLPASFLGAAIQHVVIYNLGSGSASDAYSGTNRNQINTATATSANITLQPPAQRFPLESPGKRFHLIANESVIYSCSGGSIFRSTQPISAAAPAACPTTGSILVSDVVCANNTFAYTPAISARDGLLAITLTLTRAGESVRLHDEVQVSNVP